MFGNKIIQFSLIKFVVMHLVGGFFFGIVLLLELFGLVSTLDTEDLLVYSIVVVTSLILIYVGYRESSKVENCRYSTVAKTSLFASLLLFVNPLFWGASGGHPPLPNALAVPFIFVIVLVCSFIGHYYYNRKNKTITLKKQI